MHIYIFGSLCRGEITIGSDVDMLALVDAEDSRFDPDLFSIYSYKRLGELWAQGNPFAWHLALESRLVFASDGMDHINRLGMPSPYRECVNDCVKFYTLFLEARESLLRDKRAMVFDLSTIFLSIRNFATCYSLGVCDHPDFSRHSAIRLPDGESVQISPGAYATIERARILTTRGYGDSIPDADCERVVAELECIAEWMLNLLERTKAHGNT
jgi:hypothetical protein